MNPVQQGVAARHMKWPSCFVTAYIDGDCRLFPVATSTFTLETDSLLFMQYRATDWRLPRTSPLVSFT